VSSFPFGFKYRAFRPAWKGASRHSIGLVSGVKQVNGCLMSVRSIDEMLAQAN
jgi:hypothetical protein